MRYLGLLTAVLGCWTASGIAGERKADPPALFEGRNGVVVGTTGPRAVRAGVDVLKKGGSAADAAMTTALAQVVECGGAYVSFAGILGMVYYDADTRKTYALNACYNTPLEEKDPLSIPKKGTPSGRTALVPGFMAGVQAAHDRFGKLPRADVLAPAIHMAEDGIPASAMLARLIALRTAALSRFPETKRVFTRDDGSFLGEGDAFKQTVLAQTLRQVSEQGAAYIYTGEWAKRFVAAVQREGGKITLDDMKAYRPIWEEPLRTEYRGAEVHVAGPSGFGGVTMIESLHLLERADLAKRGRFTESPASLFWLMQIGNGQVLSYLPEASLKAISGLDLSPKSRLTRETAAGIWKKMQAGEWPLTAKYRGDGNAPPMHSDGIVVVDRWGNMAAVTHSINTVLWGDTGLFVDGISIPDSATFQQAGIKSAGPGKRLPDPMCPLIVFRAGRPWLGSSAIGGGLLQRTLQVLENVLDFDTDPQTAVEAPAFLLPAFSGNEAIAQVEKNQFNRKVLDATIALGQKVKELPEAEAAGARGYWVGVHIKPDGLRRGIGTRKAPFASHALGY